MASTQLFIIMWSPVIGKIRSMNLRFGSEEFSRKNTSAVTRPHKTRSTSRNCLKKSDHHDMATSRDRTGETPGGWNKQMVRVCHVHLKKGCWAGISASNRSFNMVELAIMIQVFAMPSHEIDGRVVELRRATSQVGVSILSSGFLWLPIIYHIAHLSRPWSIGWVALSFLFVCSFVRPSRYGDIRPNLHFYFP